MGRFWIDDDFVRKHIQTHKLSLKAIAVCMALCSHADHDGHTFVGQRLLGKELGLNKETVGLAIRELIASGFVGHYKKGKHGVSGLTVSSVRKYLVSVSGHSGPKEAIKEVYQEVRANLNSEGYRKYQEAKRRFFAKG